MATLCITDYSEIRRFIEERGGEPAIVRGVAEDEEARTDMLEVAFKDSPEGELERVSWAEFFDRLERGDLALVYYDGAEDEKPPEYRFMPRIQALEEYAPAEKESVELPDSGEADQLRDNIFQGGEEA